jgi:hypothetical protein
MITMLADPRRDAIRGNPYAGIALAHRVGVDRWHGENDGTDPDT